MELANLIWSLPSIDEYWDNKLRGKEKAEQLQMIENQPALLKEWLQLKIQFGIGNPVICVRMVSEKILVSKGCFDVRDFETFQKVKSMNK